VHAFARAGLAPGDAEPLRRKKAILTLGVLLKVMACPVWVIGYGSQGFRLAAAAPLAYILLSAASTARFLVNKDFPSYSTRQIALMLALPAAMQYALGGYGPGSAVILWALLAPLMAFLFHGARGAFPWTVAFVILAAGSAVLEAIGIPAPAPTPEPLREFFFAMNVIFVALIVCATVRYFAVRLEAEQARSEALLYNVLPVPIAERLKNGEESIADLCPEVSVLFADLVGFTRLSMHVSPSEMVEMLNRIFSSFDALALRHGMEKIRTIGDGYLAVAGLPAGRPEQAVASATAAAEMALDLQETVRALASESGWPLSLRVGIQSGGPIVAGVIGTQKYVYDVWGDVVNTASRMESHGVPGGIQVTEATYQRLQDAYTFENRGLVEVKGKGSMDTYLLTGRAVADAGVRDIA
jgi:guanylate cyclase